MDIFIGILYILLGNYMDTKIDRTYKVMLIIGFSGFLLPIIFNMTQNPISEISWWITKSLPLMLSNLSMAILYAYSQYIPARWEDNICEINIGVEKVKESQNVKNKQLQDDYEEADEDENENNDNSEKSKRHKSGHSHRSHRSHHSHHSSSSSRKTKSPVTEGQRVYNENTWKPVDMVHGNDRRVVKYDHKVYDTPESRVGLTISDIVKLDSEKVNSNIKTSANKDVNNDYSDEGDIIWISKRK